MRPLKIKFVLYFLQNQLETFNQIFNKWSTKVFQLLKLIPNCNYWKQSLHARRHGIYLYKSKGGTAQIKWWKHNWIQDLTLKFNDYTLGYFLFVHRWIAQHLTQYLTCGRLIVDTCYVSRVNIYDEEIMTETYKGWLLVVCLGQEVLKPQMARGFPAELE